ncbi:MAG: peptidoglycan-associated lipoprotein Pal [Pseudomonadota bacterium]
MTTLFKVVAACALMALGACTNADRFDNANAVDLNNQAANNGIDQTALDPANNPSSPQYFSQTIGDRVLFAVDQSTLTPAGEATLRGQAGWLMTNTDYLAVIEGHADEQGTREYNLALGARRANAVREFLISQGVPASRIRTVSYGKERPIAVCSEESCYAQNRRAVTIISIGQSS